MCGLSVVCNNEQFRFADFPLVEDDPTMATEKRRKGQEGKEGKGKTRKGSGGNEDWGIGSVGKDRDDPPPLLF